MQKKENLITKLDVVVFMIIFFVIFGISFYFSLPILNTHTPLWFFGPIGFMIIIIFDIVWILIIKILFRKYKKTRILFIILGFAISTSILIWLIIERIDLFDHMFG
jgi:hypothetical protein